MKILMVCLGNICRSPLAEGIMQAKSAEKGLNWQVESAGTGSWHVGEAPDPRSQGVAHKYGIDISRQQARKFRGQDLEEFDLIYAMDSANYNDIMRHAQTDAERAKVRLIMNESSPGMNTSVPDPYWDDDGFEKVFQMLSEACDSAIARLLQPEP